MIDYDALALGMLLIIVYDTIAALISKKFGFSYSYAAIGSAVIYIYVGYHAACNCGAPSSMVTSALAGFTDATLGSLIAWKIGPGRPPSGTLSLSEWSIATVSVMGIAALFGFIGGLAA